MKKTSKKKFLSVLLSCLILCGCFSFSQTAFADVYEVVSSGSCGDNVDYTLIDDGTLLILASSDVECTIEALYPNEGELLDRTLVKSLIVEGNVITIQDEAFYGMTNLEKFEFPNSVKMIGKDIFKDCGENEIVGSLALAPNYRVSVYRKQIFCSHNNSAFEYVFCSGNRIFMVDDLERDGYIWESFSCEHIYETYLQKIIGPKTYIISSDEQGQENLKNFQTMLEEDENPYFCGAECINVKNVDSYSVEYFITKLNDDFVFSEHCEVYFKDDSNTVFEYWRIVDAVNVYDYLVNVLHNMIEKEEYSLTGALETFGIYERVSENETEDDFTIRTEARGILGYFAEKVTNSINGSDEDSGYDYAFIPRDEERVKYLTDYDENGYCEFQDLATCPICGEYQEKFSYVFNLLCVKKYIHAGSDEEGQTGIYLWDRYGSSSEDEYAVVMVQEHSCVCEDLTMERVFSCGTLTSEYSFDQLYKDTQIKKDVLATAEITEYEKHCYGLETTYQIPAQECGESSITVTERTCVECGYVDTEFCETSDGRGDHLNVSTGDDKKSVVVLVPTDAVILPEGDSSNYIVSEVEKSGYYVRNYADGTQYAIRKTKNLMTGETLERFYLITTFAFHYCKECGKIVPEGMLSGTVVSDWEICWDTVKNATCTVDGIMQTGFYLDDGTFCPLVNGETKTICATGHDTYEEYIPATYETEGTRILKCHDCDYEELLEVEPKLEQEDTKEEESTSFIQRILSFFQKIVNFFKSIFTIK